MLRSFLLLSVACIMVFGNGLVAGTAQAQTSNVYFGLSSGDGTTSEDGNYLNACKFTFTDLEQDKKLTYPAADAPGAVYNGKLYVFGGYGARDTDFLKYTQEYDPPTDSWAQKATMITARWGASAAQYDGNIYVFGGVADTTKAPIKTCESFNVANNRWTGQDGYPVRGWRW